MAVTVLIADDESNQLELLSYNLEQAGFAVVQAVDGREALQKIEDDRPDLIILDWMIGDADSARLHPIETGSTLARPCTCGTCPHDTQ